MSEDEAVEILLVEDDEGDAKLTRRGLEKANLANALVHVTDGAAALEFIFGAARSADAGVAHRPRLVLLDLKLPKVNGLEVLAAMKADPRTKTIPVVVMTSSDQDRDLAECYKRGANSFVVKPIDFDRFADTVAKLGYYWLMVNRGPR